MLILELNEKEKQFRLLNEQSLVLLSRRYIKLEENASGLIQSKFKDNNNKDVIWIKIDVFKDKTGKNIKYQFNSSNNRWIRNENLDDFSKSHPFAWTNAELSDSHELKTIFTDLEIINTNKSISVFNNTNVEFKLFVTDTTAEADTEDSLNYDDRTDLSSGQNDNGKIYATWELYVKKIKVGSKEYMFDEKQTWIRDNSLDNFNTEYPYGWYNGPYLFPNQEIPEYIPPKLGGVEVDLRYIRTKTEHINKNQNIEFYSDDPFFDKNNHKGILIVDDTKINPWPNYDPDPDGDGIQLGFTASEWYSVSADGFSDLICKSPISPNQNRWERDKTLDRIHSEYPYAWYNKPAFDLRLTLPDGSNFQTNARYVWSKTEKLKTGEYLEIDHNEYDGNFGSMPTIVRLKLSEVRSKSLKQTRLSKPKMFLNKLKATFGLESTNNQTPQNYSVQNYSVQNLNSTDITTSTEEELSWSKHSKYVENSWDDINLNIKDLTASNNNIQTSLETLVNKLDAGIISPDKPDSGIEPDKPDESTPPNNSKMDYEKDIPVIINIIVKTIKENTQNWPIEFKNYLNNNLLPEIKLKLKKKLNDLKIFIDDEKTIEFIHEWFKKLLSKDFEKIGRKYDFNTKQIINSINKGFDKQTKCINSLSRDNIYILYTDIDTIYLPIENTILIRQK